MPDTPAAHWTGIWLKPFKCWSCRRHRFNIIQRCQVKNRNEIFYWLHWFSGRRVGSETLSDWRHMTESLFHFSSCFLGVGGHWIGPDPLTPRGLLLQWSGKSRACSLCLSVTIVRVVVIFCLSTCKAERSCTSSVFAPLLTPTPFLTDNCSSGTGGSNLKAFHFPVSPKLNFLSQMSVGVRRSVGETYAENVNEDRVKKNPQVLKWLKGRASDTLHLSPTWEPAFVVEGDIYGPRRE